MGDDFRQEMQTRLASLKAAGVTQGEIAITAGVKQPLVSLASKGMLVAKTRNIDKLFEYLKEATSGLRGSTEHRPVSRDLDPRLAEALARLSDGSADGDARLAGLLEAIAAMRLGGDLG